MSQTSNQKARPIYRVGTLPGIEIEGRVMREPTLFRHNDGSLVIMEGPEEGDTRPVLIVPRVAHVKRSEAYSADDPAQLAFAEKVVLLLNDAALDRAHAAIAKAEGAS